MPTIQELTEDIRSRVDDEILSKIGETLKSIERAGQGFQDDINSLYKESKSRQETIHKLRNEKDELDTKVTKLSDNTEFENLKAENEKLKNFQSQVYKYNRDTLKSEVESLRENPNFEKVESILNLPKKEDGNYDYDQMQDDQVISVKNKISEYRTVGIFEQNQTTTKPNAPVTPSNTDDVDIAALAKSKNPADHEKVKEILKAKGYGHTSF